MNQKIFSSEKTQQIFNICWVFSEENIPKPKGEMVIVVGSKLDYTKSNAEWGVFDFSWH